MSELLFHTPWWLPTVLIGIGSFVFWTGNRRQESNVRNTGLGMILAAFVVVALSYFVETDLEAGTRTWSIFYGRCIFCARCEEVCPTGARIFGNLLDPNSEISYVLNNKRVYILKEDVGTLPRFYYFFDK